MVTNSGGGLYYCFCGEARVPLIPVCTVTDKCCRSGLFGPTAHKQAGVGVEFGVWWDGDFYGV